VQDFEYTSLPARVVFGPGAARCAADQAPDYPRPVLAGELEVMLDAPWHRTALETV
jgi:hypothetical protein